MDTTAAADQRPFEHRMVRWCAWLAAAFGALQVLTAVVTTLTARYPFRWFRSGPFDGVGVVLGVTNYYVLPLFLAVSGAGLLRWKSWARRALIVWSFAFAGLSLLTSMLFTYQYLSSTSTTTRPSSWAFPAAWLWNSFYFWAQSCALSAVFLIVLLQPEVAKIWSRSATGGFDVIPLANAADAP